MASYTIDMKPDEIRPNDWNGNRTADDGLVASVKEHGILQPIGIARDGADKFVCVYGARRLDAARKAGLEVIPCIIVGSDYKADKARLLTLVENLQREAQDPLTEGQIYKGLIAAGLSEKEVAKRTGATARQVRQRLALTKLCPQARALLYEVPYDLPALAMLAECPPTKQMTAIESMPYLLTDPEEMKDWIEGNTWLQNAPFDTSDKTLDPEAGSCADCPKRSGAQGLLFGYDEKEAGSCLDEACFARKVSANVGRSIAALRKKHPTAECLVPDYVYHYATPAQKALYDGNGAVPMKELRFATTEADKANPEAKTVILVEKGKVSEAVVLPNPREKDGRAAKPKTEEEKAEYLEKKRVAWAAKQTGLRLLRWLGDVTHGKTPLCEGRDDLLLLLLGRALAGENVSYPEARRQVVKGLWKELNDVLCTPALFALNVDAMTQKIEHILLLTAADGENCTKTLKALMAESRKAIPE